MIRMRSTIIHTKTEHNITNKKTRENTNEYLMNIAHTHFSEAHR